MSVKIQKQSQWFATFTKNREMKYLLLFVFVPLATFSQCKPVVEIQYLRKSNGNWVEAQDTIVVTTDVNQTLVSSRKIKPLSEQFSITPSWIPNLVLIKQPQPVRIFCTISAESFRLFISISNTVRSIVFKF